MRMWCEWGLHWSTTGEKDRFVLEILHKVKSCIRAFRQNRCVCVCVFSRQALMQDLHVGERPLCRILYLCRIFSVLHKSTEN